MSDVLEVKSERISVNVGVDRRGDERQDEGWRGDSWMLDASGLVGGNQDDAQVRV